MNVKETAVDARLKVGDRVRITNADAYWKFGLTGTLTQLDIGTRYEVLLDREFNHHGARYTHVMCIDAEKIEEAPEPVSALTGTPLKRKQILNAALAAVAGREEQYGGPENSFETIARLWTAALNGPIFDASDVALMLALMKIARLSKNRKHTDSWIDLAGYAACGAEVSGA